MAPSRWLTGLAVSEERVLAGRVAGALYLVGAATALALLVLPAVAVTDPALVVAIAAAGAVWGVACLTVVPWRRASPLVSHLSTAAGFPVAAIAMAVTGGSTSPARFYLLFILVYATYFYPRREAIPYVAACVATLALPLAYGTGHAAYAAELIVIVPTYAVLGALLVGGKGVLVDLRDRADDLARRDALTGLANRRALMAALERLADQSPRGGARFGLVLLDLDDFKAANTRFGHPGGDAVLEGTAAALRGASLDADVVARLGGDEFAVVVGHPASESMDAVCARLLDAIREAVVLGAAGAMRVTASAGWACHPADARSVEALVAAADGAMRAAKRDGKDRWLAPASAARATMPA